MPNCRMSSLQDLPPAESPRRISVKDLGKADCQGWLHRRRQSRSFIGSKWKKYWFVLKKSSLYWYTDKMAEKAEGFINLSGFTIEQAKPCRRKHPITASHPLIVTILIAAESFVEMNKWISKLREAAESSELNNNEECYSEDSDQDDADPEHPPAESSPCASLPTTESRSRTTSAGSALSRHRRRTDSAGSALSRHRRRTDSATNGRLSWLDLPGAGGETSLPLLHVGEEKEERVTAEVPPDEMEHLYNHLKAARLSPMGQSSQRDFRASFNRRSKNDQVNEKLHLVRILRSTLKAKESELQAVEQVLSEPDLTAPTYRKWKLSNSILLQEIQQRSRAAGGAAALRPDVL
ncbi:interactor protein for cytohesin exchange factors 1 isoform 2-T2 [Odontesthes bonariensis]|uniref:interactor protein for cytohesin exchange factors 1 isoform X2 n=1 Tax=Odontesthes bonariensis TaxID=219752 RepID=UPI003F583D4A